MTVRRLVGAALIVVGGGAFTACLESAFTGMRDVMVNDGGFCASGGPYVIARQCSSGDLRLLLVGIVGGLVAAAVYASGTSALGRSASSAGLVCWVALFGAFGWNFIDRYLHPAAGQSGSAGFLTSGIVFLALAVGGLLPLVGALSSDLRPSKAPSRAPSVSPPLVRAVIPPGFGTAPDPTFGGWPVSGTTALGVSGSGVPVDARPRARPGSAPLTTALLTTGSWLVLSIAAAAAGLALGSALVGALK